ncbi:MAG TPA: hypothetical protein VF432_33570 [Thermoanaerobaculia bacterium]
MTRRTLALVLLTSAVALGAVAQDADLRGSSGPIRAIAKQPKQLSGSLGVTTGGRQGYEATLGGAVVQDRLFFFASAQHNEGWQFASPAFQPSDDAFAFDGKATALLGERNTVTAAGGTGRSLTLGMPSSFLSLRFDSVISSNTFFSASISQRKVSQPELFQPEP